MEVTSTTRDVVGFGVNAVKGTLMGFIGAVVTFIGFIAEKIHLEFLFIFNDDIRARGTGSVFVAGEVRAVWIFGEVGFSVFAGGFLTITRARGGLVTDDDGGIFVSSYHGSIFLQLRGWHLQGHKWHVGGLVGKEVGWGTFA
jgi:hypothetical protein